MSEITKKNNDKIIADKMNKTFSSRRVEVVSLSPFVGMLKERWPALFTEAQVRMSDNFSFPPGNSHVITLRSGVRFTKQV